MRAHLINVAVIASLCVAATCELAAQTVPAPATRRFEPGWRPAALTETIASAGPEAVTSASAAPANAPFGNGSLPPIAAQGAPPAAATVGNPPAVSGAMSAPGAAPGQSQSPTAPTTAGGSANLTPVSIAGNPQSSASQAPPGTSVGEPAARVARSEARVTNGNGVLPNEHGQVWREYDISPYTLRVTTTERPEQAVVDWVLRETGYEAWHSEPLGILSATRNTIRVYHTPAMQAVVKELVDRFVSSEAETYTFSLRVMTLDEPNWRARVQKMLRPVAVQTPGVQAWLIEKEEAAAILAELQRRTDYREHSSPHLMVNNGQGVVVSAMRGRQYIRDLIARPDVWPGYEAQPGQLDEGFAIDFSPLLSLDRRMIDATLKCDIDQVEKMVPVVLEVPTPQTPRQRGKLEVPQLSQFRFHERFRWPTEQVLFLSLGVVPLPVPVDGKANIAGLPLPFVNGAPRAELLVMIDCRGPAAEAANIVPPAAREAKNYRGRY